jgi:hypothetical protein
MEVGEDSLRPSRLLALSAHVSGRTSDTQTVSGTALSALASLAERRFPSFSEAADAVLDLLEAELPAGVLEGA